MLPECLRLSKVPVVHCSIAKGGQPEVRIKTTLPTSGPAQKPLIRNRNSQSMCADFAAHGTPDCPAERATGSHQCHSLNMESLESGWHGISWLCGFGLVGWRGLVFCFRGLVWLRCVLVVSCCFLFVLAPRVCWLCRR